MTRHLSPRAIIEPLTAMARSEVPQATLHIEHGDDDYWCVSWRIGDRADRELFVEHPGRAIAPHLLRIGVYFQDAPAATAVRDNDLAALEALTSRRDALAAVGVACTFTAGASTRDDESFAWHASDLERWLVAPSPHRDLVWRWDLRSGPPSEHHLESIVRGLAPVWRIWNAL